eukprot:3826572-Pleurochrysis_carterae.AAC.1
MRECADDRICERVCLPGYARVRTESVHVRLHPHARASVCSRARARLWEHRCCQPFVSVGQRGCARMPVRRCRHMCALVSM